MAVNPDFQGGVTDDPIVNKVVDLIIKRHMVWQAGFLKLFQILVFTRIDVFRAYRAVNFV